MKRFLRVSVGAIAAFATIAPSAFAHHMEGGEMPSTWSAGLLSGLGHPVIGLDHFLFIIGVGLAAAVASRPITLPLTFSAATTLGVLAHVVGVNIAMVEVVVLASVVSVGVLLAVRPDAPLRAWLSLFAVAGFFHGYAYGEAITGNEATPLAAYLAGLGAVQFAVASGVAVLVARVLNLDRSSIKVGGGVLAGAGLAFASLLLPAISPG